MAEEEKSQNLEQVLYKLLDYQSGRETTSSDTLLMLSLINLFGIVSLLNKQPAGMETQAQGAINPMLGMLMNMLTKQQEDKRGGAGPDQGAFNPAALLNLLNLLSPSSGKTPDPSALLKMLSSLMGGYGRPPSTEEAKEKQETKSEAGENAASGKMKGVKKPEGPIKWDPRLGNATG